MTKTSFFGVFLFVGLLLLASSCKKEVKIGDLPEGVQTWISANLPGYKMDEAEKDVLCDGTPVFDVTAEKGEDMEMELTFDTNGNYLFSETDLAVGDLPAAVTAAISIKFPGSSIKEADQLAMADGSKRYEVELKNAPSKDVVFDSEGKLLCQSDSKP